MYLVQLRFTEIEIDSLPLAQPRDEARTTIL